MTNKWNKVLYTGVTNDLRRRVYEHKNKVCQGFTKRYNVDKLVYYEDTENIEGAILREKQVKGGSRKDKIQLVNSFNPEWRDLSGDLWDCFALTTSPSMARNDIV
jgi:putative endonuclease